MTGRRSRVWFWLIILLFIGGCTLLGVRDNRSAELLALDYATMSNEELQNYYYQLNDQIARVERGTRGGADAASVSPRAGASGDNAGRTTADELLDRRNEVRTELSRRELRP